MSSATEAEPATHVRVGGWTAPTSVAAMLVVGVLIVIARRPDAVTNPQFWAEDGRYWFADAYNLGIRAVLKSNEGYLVTLPRLVAIPVTGLSLSHAALIFNVVGIGVQVAPAAFFMSRRFDHLAAAAWVRAVVGLSYLLIPSFELNVTLTNAQWHLAILAVMVIVARPPLTLAGRVLDAAVVLLSSLTGPFALVLLPAAVARTVTFPARRRWYGRLSAGLLATLVVQGVAVVMGHRDAVAPLGVSFSNFVTIVADRVVLPGTFAEEGHAHVFTAASTNGLAIASLVTLGALVIFVLALVRGGASLRLFLLTCAALTGLCLMSPIATPPNLTAWTSLATSDGGERYFFVAEVAWVVCLVWALSRVTFARVRLLGGLALAAAFASGLLASWAYAPYTDYHPDRYTTLLRERPPGTRIAVPINPGWEMVLMRH